MTELCEAGLVTLVGVEPNRETAALRDGNFRRNRASDRALASSLPPLDVPTPGTRYFSPPVGNMRVIGT